MLIYFLAQLAEGVAAGLRKDSELHVTIAQVAETLPADGMLN